MPRLFKDSFWSWAIYQIIGVDGVSCTRERDKSSLDTYKYKSPRFISCQPANVPSAAENTGRRENFHPKRESKNPMRNPQRHQLHPNRVSKKNLLIHRHRHPLFRLLKQLSRRSLLRHPSFQNPRKHSPRSSFSMTPHLSLRSERPLMSPIYQLLLSKWNQSTSTTSV